MLFELLKAGYSNLNGMDYSEKSVELACSIRDFRINEGESLYENIIFYKEDINNPTVLNKNQKDLYQLLHDKGTFDAYMLNKNNSYLNYANYLYSKMKDQGILIISSVNHLKKDLLEYFLNTQIKINENFNFTFNLIEEIPHKSFNFGGGIGQTVTTLVFKINK